MNKETRWQLWQEVRKTEYYRDYLERLDSAIESGNRRALESKGWDDFQYNKGFLRGLQLAKATLKAEKPEKE